MAPDLKSIVAAFQWWCKTRQVSCPWCRWCGAFVKNGGYWRYAPDDGPRVRVQRYVCANADCPAWTFSVLAVGWLPLFRVSLTWLLLLVLIAESHSVNALARLFDCGRATIRRRLARARQLLAWFEGQWSAIETASSWGQVCNLVLRAMWPGRVHV